ncbi:MAG: hypothetical protein R6V03_03615 [Kiritimatiellia bacterium]
MSRTRRRAVLVGINIFVFVLLIAAAESICSLFAARPWDHVVPSWRLNHRWKPNSSSVHSEWAAGNPEFPEPYVHVYNAQGWLEKYDVRKKKPAGTFRIFYVGDSFTEGTVPMDASVPSLIEKRLESEYAGDDVEFEVINTGTMSYSPAIYYVLVRYVLAEYSPDLIVVNVDMTDVFDDWKYSSTLVFDDRGDPVAVPPRDPYEASFIDTEEGAVKNDLLNKMRLFLYYHSYVYNFLLNSTGKDRAEQERSGMSSRWGWCLREWSEATTANVEMTKDFLRRLASFCRGRGIKLMYTAVPHYRQFAGRPDGTGDPLWSAKPHEVIAKLAAEEDVPYLNSWEALKPEIEGTPRNRYYYSGDMHFNPRGYRIWAEVQWNFLTNRANGLLP